jgi:hypothetical protein
LFRFGKIFSLYIGLLILVLLCVILIAESNVYDFLL